ncbi:MAG: recombinase family protein [Proteobacteria bacterium]|nr:recombinase family protein [Pseudomonadota bacterium]
MQTVAIYARVSSDRQKTEQTIGSQTAALQDWAKKQKYLVPPEWVFEDEGYSGAILNRPGLERLRDLAVEGQLEAILIHSPDRLSRKYAYQVLLIEEFTRHGVEVIFLRSPKAETPEDQLLLQFQGMIAEYERAQIAERTRRGKRHRARGGSVNVLSGAPYGYRYHRKTEAMDAFYEILAAEADVVQSVFKLYTEQAMSINAIARHLNDKGIATRHGAAQWCRSTVWGMLRNPAYEGKACFGKTERASRQRITRPLRQRGGFSPRNSCTREKARQDWIEIPVPALVSEATFAMAHELLQKNKKYARRRTLEATLLQSMLVCNKCGYAYSRTYTRTSKRKIYYYRCLGSDNYRFKEGRKCASRPIRQDYLDALVWTEVMRLLEDEKLIEGELQRRVETTRNASTSVRRLGALNRENTRLEKAIHRLLDAYQAELLTMDELRPRLKDLRKKQQSAQTELRQIENQQHDKDHYLKLANTVTGFLGKLQSSANTLDIADRQRIVRLLVKEIMVDDQTITLKHAIPITQTGTPLLPSGGDILPGYLLRSGSHFPLAQ